MIEVTIKDLLLPVPKEQAEKPWRAYTTHDAVMAVWLKERQGERILTLWVGASDGSALALGLRQIPTLRPMTFDLMARLVGAGEMRLEKAGITAFHDDIYRATMWVHMGGGIHEIDARPSDAFNLALRVQASMFVDPELFERMSQAPEALTKEAQAYAEKTGKELRSLFSLPWGDGPAHDSCNRS